MNKTDKFLYGGFAAVALAGIVAMLVSVFAPPKQPAEETAKPPTPPQIDAKPTVETASPMVEPSQTEFPYYYLDENGNKVFLTQEEFDAGSEYEQEQKRKEAERLAKEKAEKEWWASRKEWVERFPFEPTYHPEITLDTAVYDPNNPKPQEERDKAYWKMRDRVQNHSFLRRFYESRLRYTEEFEQLYDIVQEEAGEKADNPIVLGWTFTTLRKYHQANAQDSEAIYRKNAHVALPRQPPPRQTSMLASLTPQQLAAYKALPEKERRTMTAELRASRSEEYVEQLRAYRNTPKYQVKDITWGEQAEKMKMGIIGALWNGEQPDQPWIHEEQAKVIRARLINEIPAEGFLKMGEGEFGYVHKYERELQPGDQLLIK